MANRTTHVAAPLISMAQWDQINWVLLDMDGTLLDLCFDDTLWRVQLPETYSTHHGVGLIEAQKTINDIADHAFGKLEWYCIDFWSDQLGFDVRPSKEKLSHLIGFRPGALAFLKWLKHQNKHVILATNAHPDSIALKDTKTDLSQWVDDIMHAHDANAPKESQTYWHWLHQQTGFISQQTLFIDDNDHILDAATKFGIMHSIGVATPNSMRPASRSKYPSFDHFQELYLPSI